MNQDDAGTPTPASADGGKGDFANAPTVVATASNPSEARAPIASQSPEPGTRIGGFAVLRPLLRPP